ncbi:MAG: GNAT family N-acetyltransferase [Brachymonas sp.]|nr:GNAT family N-acetyltransferase [Brachymonas sp.]
MSIKQPSATQPSSPALHIRRVDYNNAHDAAALVQLLNAYAQDPMGGQEPLLTDVQATLCQRLAAFPGAASWIAWADGAEPVGLLNSFLGFSTFKAQPLLNVHDIAVLPAWRGQGVAQQLLAAAEAHAREQGCCKLTLEVLSNNTRAQGAYQRFGFELYTLDATHGHALFMQKWL